MYSGYEHDGLGYLLEAYNIWILYYMPLEFLDSLPLN